MMSNAQIPEAWEPLLRFLTLPISWVPGFQDRLLELAWAGTGFTGLMARGLLILPVVLVVVATWSTMLGLYTVPFRSARGRFLTTLTLLWWEVGRSIWLFWVGMGRFLLVLAGWAWAMLRMAGRMLVGAVRHAFASPFVMMDWMGRRYFKPGVPWIAFLLTLGWSALEALIFTFTLHPTVSEVFWDLAGFQPGQWLAPILFLFLFVLIAGSFASLQVLAEALEKRQLKAIIQMCVVEFFVMFFEVVFLYRELIDAITPWLAAQTGGQLRLGIFWTLGLASFGWVGIRAMTWFLFARYGTPALIAVLARETLSMAEAPEAPPQTVEADWWREPIAALKRETDFYRARARELLELLSLPVLQVLAACVNCATVVINGRHMFDLPFTSLDQVMETTDRVRSAAGKRVAPASTPGTE